MTIFGMDYQTFWAVVFGIVLCIATIPLYGIWIELRRWRKANERPGYPIDDKYDEMER
jgi:hypothetical protein